MNIKSLLLKAALTLILGVSGIAFAYAETSDGDVTIHNNTGTNFCVVTARDSGGLNLTGIGAGKQAIIGVGQLIGPSNIRVYRLNSCTRSSTHNQVTRCFYSVTMKFNPDMSQTMTIREHATDPDHHVVCNSSTNHGQGSISIALQ